MDSKELQRKQGNFFIHFPEFSVKSQEQNHTSWYLFNKLKKQTQKLGFGLPTQLETIAIKDDLFPLAITSYSFLTICFCKYIYIHYVF